MVFSSSSPPLRRARRINPRGYARPDTALTDLGYGPLTDVAAYEMSIAQKQVVLIRSDPSTAAVDGAVTHTGAGSSVVTATGTTALDDFDAMIKITLGGTVGTGPISLKYSLDGGLTYSGVVSLGTATTYTIPNSGCTFAFGTGTVATGQTEAFHATAPQMTNADLVVSLEALRTYAGAWDAVYVHMHADATTVSTLNTWLLAREAEGKYKTAVVNAIPRDAVSQTEAQLRDGHGHRVRLGLERRRRCVR